MQALADWLKAHPSALWIAGISLVLMVGGSIAASIAAVRIPADFFTRPASKRSGALRIVLNIAGWLLILAGIAMIIFPGPGILVVVAGISLADFPGKQRVIRWIISRPTVLRGLNRLRARHGRPPLKLDVRKSAVRPKPPVRPAAVRA